MNQQISCKNSFLIQFGTYIRPGRLEGLVSSLSDNQTSMNGKWGPKFDNQSGHILCIDNYLYNLPLIQVEPLLNSYESLHTPSTVKPVLSKQSRDNPKLLA